MNVLSLFSGIGGIDVAVKLVLPEAKTVAYVERDKYCQVLLKARMNDGSLDTAPIIDDVRDASVASIPDIDIIIGGFPCQPFSFAGLRKENDERNLWPEFNRTIRSIRPRYVFLENVPGILTAREHEGYIFTILKDLNQGGYDAEWGTIKASDVGASHKRERWFCLAWRRDLADPHQERLQGGFGYTSGKEREDGTSVEHDRNDIRSETGRSSRTLADSQRKRQPRSEPQEQPRQELLEGSGSTVANCNSQRLEGVESGCSNTQGWQEPDGPFGLRSRTIPTWPPGPSQSDEWGRILAERPDLSPALTKDSLAHFRGMVDGRSHRVDELKALGNGVVPAVVALFLRRLQ